MSNNFIRPTIEDDTVVNGVKINISKHYTFEGAREQYYSILKFRNSYDNILIGTIGDIRHVYKIIKNKKCEYLDSGIPKKSF